MKKIIGALVPVLAASACAASSDRFTGAQENPVNPAEPVYVAGDVSGASSAALSGLFGEPSLVRKEGEGVFQRYSLKQCELIVILYPDDKGVSRVAHIDTTARRLGDPKPDVSACLAAG